MESQCNSSTSSSVSYEKNNDILKQAYKERMERELKILSSQPILPDSSSKNYNKFKQFVFNGYSIQIEEIPGFGIGSSLWNSSIPICKYLEMNKNIIEGKRVIELGAGVGLVSIVCALLGGNVVSTDKKRNHTTNR